MHALDSAPTTTPHFIPPHFRRLHTQVHALERAIPRPDRAAVIAARRGRIMTETLAAVEIAALASTGGGKARVVHAVRIDSDACA